MTFSSLEIARASGGEAVGAAEISGFSIDSRTIRAGELFIALAGTRTDGHEFAADAAVKGAGALVSADWWGANRSRFEPPPPGKAFIVVDDPLTALGDIAEWHRSRFSIPLIAVTGSNGKTTTKEMIAVILRPFFSPRPVLKSEGNYNNQIGLPLTLLAIDPSHAAAVVEVGINRPGEMRRLAAITRPTIGLVTNIGMAHLEFLGSPEGVAREKGELLEALEKEGTAIVNADEPQTTALSARLGSGGPRVITFGFGSEAAVRGDAVEMKPNEVRFRLILPSGRSNVVLRKTTGRHQVANALAASAATFACGAGADLIASALAGFEPIPMRGQPIDLRGIRIVHDAYNANPTAMKAALETLSVFPGRRLLLLGGMRELGEFSPEAHRMVGRWAAQLKPELLIAVGEEARGIAEGAVGEGMPRGLILTVASPEEGGEYLLKILRPGDTLLVKGSRAIRLERAVDRILEGLR